jgi:hypothetical protein
MIMMRMGMTTNAERIVYENLVGFTTGP